MVAICRLLSKKLRKHGALPCRENRQYLFTLAEYTSPFIKNSSHSHIFHLPAHSCSDIENPLENPTELESITAYT